MPQATAPTTANPANAPSARFFGSIGIAPGMRVLDVGCGDGDLSRFLADLVGPTGEVVAVDRSDAALTAARATMADACAAPIHYLAADLAGELPPLDSFDAIVGRRVLMYLPDASATIGRLAALAKQNAILAFQEHARAPLPLGLGELAFHRRLYDWMWETVAAEGGDVTLGLRLADVMRGLGLSLEEVRGEAILLRPDEPSFLPTLARVMLPRMVEHGITSEGEVELDTIAGRLQSERDASRGTVIWDLAHLVSARAAVGT